MHPSSPHHQKEKKRKPSLIKQIRRYGGIGLALDDWAAIEILDDKFRIIPTKSFAKAHKVYKQKGKIVYEKIETNKFIEVNYLLKK